MKKKKYKCPRCGGTKSFKDDCGYLNKKIAWCSRCGYLMESLTKLAKAINASTGATVIGYTK